MKAIVKLVNGSSCILMSHAISSSTCQFVILGSSSCTHLFRTGVGNLQAGFTLVRNGCGFLLRKHISTSTDTSIPTPVGDQDYADSSATFIFQDLIAKSTLDCLQSKSTRGCTVLQETLLTLAINSAIQYILEAMQLISSKI